MLHCNLYIDAVTLALTVNNVFIQSFFALVQILNKLFDTALVMEGFCALLSRSLVRQDDAQVFGQECHFTQTLTQYIIVIYRILKNASIRGEGYFCTSLLCRAVTNDFQRIHGFSTLIALLINVSVSAYLNFQPVRKGVYYGSTYTVQSAGYFVPSTAKFSTCMQNGKYNLYRRFSGFVVDVYRDSTAVIGNGNGIAFVDRYIYLRAKSCKRLIHCIIHNLVYKMVKSAGRSTSDIHTRSFSYCFETFQNLNLISTVFCTHSCPPTVLLSCLP